MRNTQYVVLLNAGQNQAIIALEGYEPTDGSVAMGTFELPIDKINSQTAGSTLRTGNNDHPFINAAKEALRNNEDFNGNVDSLIFLDKASNAPVHDENVGSTDQLDVVDEGSDPEISNQAGGEGSTDPAKDPADTEANGVQDKHERTDEGDTTNAGETGGTGEDATNQKSETVADLTTRLQGITNKDELQREYEAEQNGANRSTAIAAFEARAKELDAPAA